MRFPFPDSGVADNLSDLHTLKKTLKTVTVWPLMVMFHVAILILLGVIFQLQEISL